MSKKVYYGLQNQAEIVSAARRAVRTFGGGDKAVSMLVGTACTETDMGTFKDKHPEKLGVGLNQFDLIRFKDLQTRTRRDNANVFYKEYGVSLIDLELEDLAYDPYLSMACCRLAYILIPEAIPEDVEGQAEYWKTHWNTYAKNAKGTPDEYLRDWFNHNPYRRMMTLNCA